MNGSGKKILQSGNKYKGNFDVDKINDNGIYIFKNESKWERYSIKGLKDGMLDKLILKLLKIKMII